MVHIIPTLDQGGAEKQLCLLCAHLDRAQFETQVIVLTHSGPREPALRAAGIPVHHIHKRAKFDPYAYWRLKAKLIELRPDIVHTWLFAANAYGRAAAKAAKVPVIVAGERSVDPWKGWWQIAIDRWLMKSTSAVITNTSAVTDFYASRHVPTERFVVIPNAVEPPSTKRLSRAEVFERLGIPPRSKLVMAIGRLWPQKGYRDLIWAGELLHVGYDDVWVVIVGDGPERARLQHFRDQTRSDDAVRFVGERADALELLSGADLLWNGSLYEGQSNTILEAMALGIPVVASDIPGTRDLVIPDQTGYLYKLGDVASLTRLSTQLLNDTARLARLGANAAARARDEFSIERMVQRHADQYAKLLNS
ncbi:MAG: glycosyltransferase [Pirellulaceae bacterium]|nr:glycosyltransferase [Pirellulaceae bacterium]